MTTWSLVDSFWRRKPAFYTTKTDFARIMVGISRVPVWHLVDENKRLDPRSEIPTWQVYASNLAMDDRKVELRLRMYDWSTHEEIRLDGQTSRQRYQLGANKATELLEVNSPSQVRETPYIILAATLHDINTGEELSRHFSWPEPYRYLLAAEGTRVDVTADAEEGVMLTCGQYPAKGVVAYIDEADDEEPDWTDNMVDMLPGESIKLPVKGLTGREVKTKWLYSWEIARGRLSHVGTSTL